jgi:hypothetical protein
MEQYKEVLRQITRLDSMIPSGFLASDNWDFKALWAQIRATSLAFKGVRFPSSAEHQEAWNRFQELVQKVKSKEDEKRSQFLQRRETSAEIRDDLLRMAGRVLPDDSALGDLILAMATGGLSIILEQALDALLGPFDKRKDELLRSSQLLRDAWGRFSAQKAKLLREDKDTVYHALKNTQDKLDDLWAQYKEERERAVDAYHRERRQRHEAWRERTLENVRKSQERRSRLEDVLSHKRSHLSTLYDKLSGARSDEYRNRVEGWIEEEREAIRDIGAKIEEISNWIEEDLKKLNG